MKLIGVLCSVVAVSACGPKGGGDVKPPYSGSGSSQGVIGEICPIEGSPTAGGNCPTYICGNSAEIYGSVVEALDLHGVEVQNLEEPFRLLRGTLTGAKGRCLNMTELSLGMRDGGLVGVSGPPENEAIRCADNELVGATFEVEQKRLKAPESKKVRVRIKSIDRVAVWTAGEPQTLPVYDFVAEDPLLKPQPLCRAASWDQELIGVPDELGWRAKSTHALVIQGETYKRDATRGKTGARWFNIGCAGSGISKLRLLGLDPMKDSTAGGPGTTVQQRQATLKMLTAKYCGEHSWTRNGVAIMLRGQLPPRESGAKIGPIESSWNGNGATCLSHLRLWHRKSPCTTLDEAAIAQKIRETCNIPMCEIESCETSSPPSGASWNTCTVDHVPEGVSGK